MPRYSLGRVRCGRIAFAGEDRQKAESIVNVFTEHALRVFYDKHVEASLWGEDLYNFISDVFEGGSRGGRGPGRELGNQ